MSHWWCKPVHRVGLFRLLGRELFDAGRQIIKVAIAFDRVDKLRTGKSSEEECRLVFILTGRRLLARVSLRLASVQEFLEDLDLSLESAAHFGGCRLSVLWMSLGLLRVLVRMKTFLRRHKRSVILSAASQSFLDLRLGEDDRNLPKAIEGRRQVSWQVVHLDTFEHFFDLLKQ